jgi:aminoglycoside 3-N-acetyltransferase
MWHPDQITQAFREIGLKEGDTVLVHSALRTLGPVEGGADGVTDALLAAVGATGTVAVPTHTWSTVHNSQPVFHQTLSPSIVGTLTNVFRQRPEAVRGLHPTHSVAVIGPRAVEFVSNHELDDTPCSPTSPYGKLITWQGKVGFIGKGLECCTFFHCVEELAELTWNLTESHQQLNSITADGRVISVPSRRHQHGVSDNYPRLDAALLEAGILCRTYLDNCPIALLDAAPAAAWLEPQLRANPTMLW